MKYSKMDSLVKLSHQNEVERMYTEAADIQSQIETSNNVIEREQQKVVTLLKHPSYKPPHQVQYLGELLAEMCDLKEKMKGLLLLGDDVKSPSGLRTDDDQTGCTICMTSAKRKQIFECDECGNWVCADCCRRLRNCPSCRACLSAHPMRRSRALERFMLSS